MASACLTFAMGLACVQAGSMEEEFKNPPASARPHTWWHWMNGNVTREGITADLEAMKHVGINGAQIFNVGVGTPKGPATVLGPQWLDLVQHAATEADRLGMDLAMHNCPGWSSSGGPWITPEHSMQTVVTSEIQVQGGTHLDAVLPQPAIKLGFYRDIAVLAFPTPTEDKRIPDLEVKMLSGGKKPSDLQPDAKAVPLTAVVSHDRIINLTGQMGADGKLAWDVPAGGAWTILRLGHTPNGRKNVCTPENGGGWECDKLSREALDAHWNDGIAPVLRKLGPLAGKVFNNLVIDSYEVGNNNWTPRLREEFIQRRGYDPILFLPVLTGRYVDGGEISERFLWDFRRTLCDLFTDNYYGYFCDLCHKAGLKASIEPYDGPFESLAVAAKADVPMGEFWSHDDSEAWAVRIAAESAHVHGQTIVGAESFTALPETGKWLNHPGSLKALGDQQWCAGLNRFIFHVYAMQPWMDKAPGMTMGVWGTHFGRNNTWWEQSRAWMAYINRGQYLLQQGHPVADVLFFTGEAAPSGAIMRPDLRAKGYDYDALGTDLMPQLTVQDGCVVTPTGGKYRLLVLPNTTWMTPALVQQVGALVQAGATVIAPRPLKSPSLKGYPACDGELARLAPDIWGPISASPTPGKHYAVASQPVDKVLSALGVQPDFLVPTPDQHITFVHRSLDAIDVYFVSNPRPITTRFEASFRITGRLPELWDAETGIIRPAPVWRVENGRTVVPLNLEQSDSIFVVFRQPATAPVDSIIALTSRATGPSTALLPPKLEIRKAFYGVLKIAPGLLDVTSLVQDQMRDGRGVVPCFFDLAGNGAMWTSQELRVEYECGGQTRLISLPSEATLSLPAAGETGPVRILRAIFGHFEKDAPKDLKGLPPLRMTDVTTQLAVKIADGLLSTPINSELFGGDPAPKVAKTAWVKYAVNGVEHTAILGDGQALRIPEETWLWSPPEPRLSLDKGHLQLTAATAGTYALATASGGEKNVEVGPIPVPLEVPGPWQVAFQEHRGAPASATFPMLLSWPDHADAGVKYFSGTAAYRATVTIPADRLGTGRSLLLDLGQVKEIAEVTLNGVDLGTLWKAPFRVDISAAAKAGENRLQVKVTNLWPNRLIGDEQLPEDCEWNGVNIRRWPDWMVKGLPRPTSRVTFTTCKFWKKESSLQPSGLIGPVTLRTLSTVPVP